ncbi:Mitogen-activated protein kinase [Serendipita sp. 400]|nr:Mitogen-activated protein kinase [Serendipita sp. 400]
MRGGKYQGKPSSSPYTMLHSFPIVKTLAPVPQDWQPYTLDPDYQFITTLPSSSHRLLVAARHNSGEICSIQKLTAASTDIQKAKAYLKELKMLRHLRAHKNILCVYDMDIEAGNGSPLMDIYLYTELPRSNLASILNSKKSLSKRHIQFIMYQLFCALKYVHSTGIIHMSIRPSNILIDANVTVRLCDFSTATTYEAPFRKGDVTPPLATEAVLFYKAPEILLGGPKPSFPVDIWSAGCILAEILNGGPIFDRKDLPGQIRTIISYLGTPSDEVLNRIASVQTANNLRATRHQAALPFTDFVPGSSQDELSILRQTLIWDPKLRSAASDILESGYFAAWRNGGDEIVSHKSFRWDIDWESSQEAINRLLLIEVAEFRSMVRQGSARGSDHAVLGSRNWPPHDSLPQSFDGSEEDGDFEWAE